MEDVYPLYDLRIPEKAANPRLPRRVNFIYGIAGIRGKTNRTTLENTMECLRR